MPAPHANPFDSLTTEQLEALRLVRDGFTSKQIAQRLDISRWAVDQRIDRARARIGAGDRAEAARMLAAWERDADATAPATSASAIPLAAGAETGAQDPIRPTYERAYEGFVREPTALPNPRHPGNVGASYTGPSTVADENRVREMPARFGESGGISLLGPYGDGERKHGRNPLNTLALIVLATMALAIALTALPTLVRNAQEIANTVKAYRPLPRK